MQRNISGRACLLLLVLSMAFNVKTYAMGQENSGDNESTKYAKQLASRNADTRQAAAEALARMVALDQKKIVEGYLLQEKDNHVRLALNWALYRMGKTQLLVKVIRDLNSSRREQAFDYLTQIDSPSLLYPFLQQENQEPRIASRLLDVLGRIGDAESLAQIKPFGDSFDPKISEAAQSATLMIQHRLGETQPVQTTRPRTVGKSDQP